MEQKQQSRPGTGAAERKLTIGMSRDLADAFAAQDEAALTACVKHDLEQQELLTEFVKLTRGKRCA